MAITSASDFGNGTNPLDLVEDVMSQQGWTFSRQSDEELTASTTGRWCAYQLWFTCREDPGALQFSCAFDLKVPDGDRERMALLLAMVNERMWLGHFDLWWDEGVLMYHHALLLGPTGVAPEQCEEMVEIAIEECERFFPAFYFILNGDMSAVDALDTALLDPAGEA